MRIIITDDHPRFRALLRSMLAGLADDFVECANGAEAVTACQTRRPDWLLTDIRMPVMDGLAAVRVIKANLDRTGLAKAGRATDVDALLAHAAHGAYSGDREQRFR